MTSHEERGPRTRRLLALQYSAWLWLACDIDNRNVSPGDGISSTDDGGSRLGGDSEDGGGDTGEAEPGAERPENTGGAPGLDDAGSEAGTEATSGGALVWVHHVADAFINGLAFDATEAGDLVAAGSFYSNVLLGNEAFSTAGGSDGYLMRLAKSDGAVIRAMKFGASGDEGPLGIVGAPDGSFATQGYYTSVPNFGGGDHTESVLGGLFVTVHEPDFSLRWAKSIDSGSFGLTGNALDVNSNGSPMIAGSFQNPIDLGATPLTSVGQSDGIFARFRASDGVVEQFVQLGTSGAESGTAAHYLLGNNVIAGTFDTTLALGAEPELTARGGKDIFIASFTNAGTYQWRIGIGGELDDGSVYLAHDRAGDVYVLGAFQQTLQIGAFSLETHGGSDIFMARLSPTGIVEWASAFGGGGNDVPRGIAVSPLGAVSISGEFAGEIDFGGGNRPSQGDFDAFVASFGSDGAYRWDHTYGGALTDRGLGVIVDEDGSVYTNIEFLGAVDFGQGLLDAGDTYDCVVLRYEP